MRVVRKYHRAVLNKKNLVQHNSNIYILYSTQRVYILNWQITGNEFCGYKVFLLFKYIYIYIYY